MRKLSLTPIAVIFLGGVAAFAQNISLQFSNGAFKVSGWPAPANPPARGWQSVFEIYAGAGNVPALLGDYAVEGGRLVFNPTYPIAAGVHYRAVFHSPSGGAPLEKTFDGPVRATNKIARVERAYPTSETWPSNQLRFYIYFSAPMSRAEAASHIHILDAATGRELIGPTAVFLPGEELWDPTFQRLTLTLDPGRIKRGLTSNQALGPPLTEGKRYTLVVDASWPDARGVPMAAGFRRTIKGGPSERIPPDPQKWTVNAPAANTTAALSVVFPTPMNYPLLQRMIRISGPKGFVNGKIEIAREETEWRFTPNQPWAGGSYNLVIETGLEDRAGNHIGEPFDVDVFNKVTEHIETKTVNRAFTVR